MKAEIISDSLLIACQFVIHDVVTYATLQSNRGQCTAADQKRGGYPVEKFLVMG